MRLVVATFVAAIFAAPAGAADIENVRSLDLAVRGSIPERCAMGSIGNMDFGDLNRTGLGAQARVRLDCNIPFNMSIRARNGSLAHSDLPAGQGPYSGTLPYTIGVMMPVRRPQSAVIERSFESRELRGNGRTISSEGGIAVDGLALSVSLGRPSGEAGLLAGEYGETIEITITPS
ncbi:hypothetical protein [Sphingosinicella sp. CPCC 101087]|uniref:hypothetical protein n=1 Tax=Sphingosinicella sp. CPCC 101087 TaxID=2497754 RepID=UPI00101DE555|nr:hypothetical protein [Sphingosinicella sp. CPCC 101087]